MNPKSATKQAGHTGTVPFSPVRPRQHERDRPYDRRRWSSAGPMNEGAGNEDAAKDRKGEPRGELRLFLSLPLIYGPGKHLFQLGIPRVAATLL